MDKVPIATNTTQGNQETTGHLRVIDISSGLAVVEDNVGRPLPVGSQHGSGGVMKSTMDQRSDVFDDDEGIVFALDEDHMHKPVGSLPRHYTDDFDPDGEDEDDEFDTNVHLKHEERFPVYERVRRSGKDGAIVGIVGKQKIKLSSKALALPASLPVTITNSFWPPKEAVDSLDDVELDENGSPPPAKTILPQREPRNVYEDMQAYSRSIQPADDPERLFGERPRRRYKTGEPAEPLRGPPRLPGGTHGTHGEASEHEPSHQPRIVVPASLTGH
uniref:Uncharacterized protein n=1 Tax=Acrobeloides nanus TaxID=290746 RepID=A0A914D6W4_9BILA